MNEAYPYWLSEQMLAGVRRFNIDAYLVALEGWRRGLSLKFYGEPSEETDLQLIGFDPIGKTFSLSSENRTHFFYRSRGDSVANEAVEIGSSKMETKNYLTKASVPSPGGFEFTTVDDLEEVVHSALELGFPIVLKPTFGSLGKGVIANIQTEDALRDSISYVTSEFDYKDYIIEHFIVGEDIRVYVVEDQVVGATKRIPANVTGDGINTIEELIHLKNEKRKLNPQTSTRLIKVDKGITNHLALQNLQLDHVPEKDEVIYLQGQSNISAGGDSIDATHELMDDVKNTAIKAVNAIPGLSHAGPDIIVNEDGAVVIEINITAGISLHTFPLYGEQQNIAEKIIDHYFPETKGAATKSTKIYFDYKQILELLRSKSIKQIEVADAPVGELYAKRYVISGKVQGVGFRRWARKQAIEKGLHGYARNLKNGKVVVVVAGVNKEAVDGFKDMCWEGPEKAEVEDIQEYSWDKQVRVGFEIRKEKGKPKKK